MLMLCVQSTMSYYQARSKTTRPYKGENTLKLTSDYCVIDIETSKNGRRYGEIVEISSLKVRDNQIIDVFDTLVKPIKPIDSWTQSIHHITNKMVQNAPMMSQVYPKFLEFVGSDVLVGHNVHFDINFIYDYHQELNQPPLSNTFIDTLRLARRTVPGLASYSLSNLSVHFGYEATKHRALGDCENTHLIYQAMKNRLTTEELEYLATLKVGRYLPRDRTSLSDIKPTLEEPLTGHLLTKKKVCFTGRLKGVTRKQAAQWVVNVGGIPMDYIDNTTDYLVVADINKLTSKLIHAKRLKHITILSQEEFMNLLID